VWAVSKARMRKSLRQRILLPKKKGMKEVVRVVFQILLLQE
jgi:hypothetical protein